VSYLVLARKWRPQTFRDLIGQEHVSQTLNNAIESGRIAHAFLFTGGRGVGKTSAARILAKALNCEQGPATEPCNECSSCREITAGNSVDVFEIDGASNTGVDDIRELRETVKYLPSRSRYKIFIIDEVHMLTNNAFNALLKTLEEPPAHVKFIFATTEPHKVPITILSRCQRFDFKRISLPMIVARLRYILDQEKVTISDTALAMIARKGDGSMRDSLSTLDQVLAFCGDEVHDEEVISLLGVVDRRLLLALSRALFAADCTEALDIVRRVDLFGYSMRHFCQELIDHFRSMTILKAVGAAADLPDLSAGERGEIEKLASDVSLSDLQRHLSILLKAESDMAHSGFVRLILEMALMKMATLTPVVPVNEILERLKALTARSGGPVVASSQPTWQAPGRPAAGDRQPGPDRTAQGSVKHASAPPAQSPQTAKNDPPVDVTTAPPASAPLDQGDAWSGLVAFIKGKKPMLASFLEHGHPIAISPDTIEIGFAAGSFQLSRLRDPDATADLQALAKEFFRSAAVIRLVPLPGDATPPPSLLEKKSLEHADRNKRMKELATGHPMVNAALEIFGGELVEVRKKEKT
jgi:DNA polymerase III subunit gamma/tau